MGLLCVRRTLSTGAVIIKEDLFVGAFVKNKINQALSAYFFTEIGTGTHGERKQGLPCQVFQSRPVAIGSFPGI
jgi:hypothetical protein